VYENPQRSVLLPAENLQKNPPKSYFHFHYW